ncbi:MAG: hypothetical protein CMI09_14710 [Oceanospirillaceae bacterium]|nr:hypothetical protein [Oceanospirillaceae bacterium]|tara:strand:- start:14140 stop:15090 length:951 start_codon:yes stop_codon:yes gene_type:complete
MARGPLDQQDYKPQFSGHETFPLRYGWLKKCYDRVHENDGDVNSKRLCWGKDAIARFGVGKNMVSSIRHWAVVSGVVDELVGTNQVTITPLGKLIFGEKGVDPYLEHPSSLWLIHWKLATEWRKKTTWYWAFSYYSAVTFEREKLIIRLHNRWPDVSKTTIKNDVDCFVRTYAVRSSSGKVGKEDSLECPLTELGLIKPISTNDEFRFVRGPKATLGDGTFVYALLEFWNEFSPASSTLSFEAIAYEPGSPGRVFLLDENSIADRLFHIADVTNNALRWSETAGLKQVVRNPDFDFKLALDFVQKDFDRSNAKEVA